MGGETGNLGSALSTIQVGKPAGSNPAADACPDCGGAGWIFGEDRARRCDCLKRQIRAERQKKFDAEIPPRFRSCSREGWKGTWPLTLPLTWVPTPGKSPWAVVVWGPPGTGKTHAATALYRELLARFEHLAGMWLSTEEMVSRVKGDFGGDAVTKRNIEEVDLLLLDDVGRSRESAFTLELVRSILYRRHLNQMPTIVTCNAAKLSDFDVIDPTLSDRLSISEGAFHGDFTRKANFRLRKQEGGQE